MQQIKLVIGLGNPGHSYYNTRHSIGFRVLDAFAQRHGLSWQSKNNMEYAEVVVNGTTVYLVKPQTFMNSSGAVVPSFLKKGITTENILVVHDELELPFGKLAVKCGGSAKGHNGLKSIIAACGDQFQRLRFGIGRPVDRDQVPTYVLQKFSEDNQMVEGYINQAVDLLDSVLNK